MTREEAIRELNKVDTLDMPTRLCEAHYMAINSLEIDERYELEYEQAEPCDDCISRQATIKYLCTNMNWYDEDGGTADDEEKLNAITDLVNGVPPVTPQPKTGHWIDDKCSVCGKGIEDLIESHEWYTNEEPNFCPFCGLKLVEPQEKVESEAQE